MLLRSLTKHVRDQNWIAVAIDFGIVVIGVFIGIQVANWNDELANHEAEKRFLQNLGAELAEDHIDLSNIAGAARARVMAVNYILEQALQEPPPAGLKIPTGNFSVIGRRIMPFPGGLPTDLTAISPPWAVINFVKTGFSKRGTYDALVNSGDINLLRNYDLVHKLHTYYNRFSSIESVQEHRFLSVWDSTSAAGRRHGLSSFDESPAAKIIEIAREDAQFVVALKEAREMATLQFHLVSGLEQRAEELISMIEGSGQGENQ